MAGMRHRARVMALQALYESDCAGHDPVNCLDTLTVNQPLTETARAFARELIEGVISNKEKIDTLIQSHAPSWPVAQLPLIDRNILRLAIFEISIENRVPLKAAINEAVELAKTFGSENSPKFVNGVLGAISKTKTK